MPGFCRGIAARERRGLRGESGLEGGLDPRVGKYLVMALVVLIIPSGGSLERYASSDETEQAEGLNEQRDWEWPRTTIASSWMGLGSEEQLGRDTSDNVCKCLGDTFLFNLWPTGQLC